MGAAELIIPGGAVPDCVARLIEGAAALWWLAPLSLLLFFGTLAVVPLLVMAMPADYFLRERRSARRHPLALVRALLKNLLGLVIAAAGLVMLVTPGQGILTILIGLGMLNFPGKRALELRLVGRPGVRAAIDWIRRRGNRQPLLLPGVTESSSRHHGRSPDR